MDGSRASKETSDMATDNAEEYRARIEKAAILNSEQGARRLALEHAADATILLNEGTSSADLHAARHLRAALALLGER